jgi:hypothetical protein
MNSSSPRAMLRPILDVPGCPARIQDGRGPHKVDLFLIGLKIRDAGPSSTEQQPDENLTNEFTRVTDVVLSVPAASASALTTNVGRLG